MKSRLTMSGTSYSDVTGRSRQQARPSRTRSRSGPWRPSRDRDGSRQSRGEASAPCSTTSSACEPSQCCQQIESEGHGAATQNGRSTLDEVVAVFGFRNDAVHGRSVIELSLGQHVVLVGDRPQRDVKGLDLLLGSRPPVNARQISRRSSIQRSPDQNLWRPERHSEVLCSLSIKSTIDVSTMHLLCSVGKD